MKKNNLKNMEQKIGEGKDKLKIMSLYKETAEYRYFGSIFNDAGIYELLDVLKEKEMQCNNFSFSKDRD